MRLEEMYVTYVPNHLYVETLVLRVVEFSVYPHCLRPLQWNHTAAQPSVKHGSSYRPHDTHSSVSRTLKSICVAEAAEASVFHYHTKNIALRHRHVFLKILLVFLEGIPEDVFLVSNFLSQIIEQGKTTIQPY